MSDLDHRVRLAAIAFLDQQRQLHGETLPRTVLAQGFEFDGRRVPLLGPEGIFKPAILPTIPLSITTAPPSDRKPRPYDDEFDPSGFATVLYGVLSCDGRLTYSNAGHNPALIVGRRGVRRLEQGGVIIGAFPDAAFEEETVQLDPGDVVVVFSDGVTEAMNVDGAEFGEQRLLSSITDNRECSPTALLECILAAVHEFSAGAEQSDDVTALVLRYTG